MQVDYIVQVRNWKELHHWLSQNCHSAKHCWVLTTRSRKRNTLKNTLDYLDTVEMALCFGWIDSTFKKFLLVNLHSDYHQGEKIASGLSLTKNESAAWKNWV